MQRGQTWVFSDTLGLLRDRQGDIHLTAPTRRYPQVAELLMRWLTDRLPPETKNFACTSINVNCNYAAATHRDNGNFGPSFIKAFGDFSGGQLYYWPEDSGGSKVQTLPQAEREVLDLQKNLVLFNGNCAHGVQPFCGARYSLVYFTLGSHAEATAEDRTRMDKLGFPMPTKRQDPYELLRPPKGYGSKRISETPAKNGKKHAYRCFADETLSKCRRKPKSAAEAKKISAKRVQPENARSFYRTDQRRVRKYGEGDQEVDY